MPVRQTRDAASNVLSFLLRLLPAIIPLAIQLPARAHAQEQPINSCLDVLVHAGKSIKTFDYHHNVAAAVFREMCSSDEGYVHRTFDKKICATDRQQSEAALGFPIENIPVSFGVGSSNARDYCKGDQSLDLGRWRNDKCSADMGLRSVDFQSRMVEEIPDKSAIEAWRECTTRQLAAHTQGLSCFIANPGENAVVRVISRPDLHDGIKVTRLEVANGKLVSAMPELLSAGAHDFSLERKDRSQSIGFVLAGQVSATTARTFSCNLELPRAPCRKPQYRERAAEQCGIHKLVSGRGPACGVDAYKTARTQKCGVERYRAKSEPPCKIERYKKCIHSACGHHPFPHGGRKKCRTAGCGVERYESCRRPEFGIEKYRSCRHPDHGVEQYRLCEHREFGVEFKTCRLPEFGLEACLDDSP